MSASQQIGLYATPEMAGAAAAGRETEPTRWGWAFLTEGENTVLREVPAPTLENRKAMAPVVRRALDDGEQALLSAFAAHYLEDATAQAHTVGFLQTGYGLDGDASQRDSLERFAAATQMAALVGADAMGAAWQQAYAERFDAIANSPADAVDVEAWAALAVIVGGVLMQNREAIRHGTERVRLLIHLIHPEGYIPQVVQGGDAATLERMLATISALVLSAEAAAHAGESLWNHENRGVGIMTSVAYIVYYYYYPEKWKWAQDLPAEAVRELFVRRGAFLEISERHQTLPGSTLILGELRPMFSLSEGGLTTLTHASPAPKKKRGWLW